MDDKGSLVVEQEGGDWSFTFDRRAVPDYLLLTLRGKSTALRTRKLIEVVETHLASVVDDEGSICPLIVDLQEQGSPSMIGLQSGKEIFQSFGGRITFAVALVSSHRRDTRLMQSFLTVLESWIPGRKFAIAYTMADALEKVSLYRERKRSA